MGKTKTKTTKGKKKKKNSNHSAHGQGVKREDEEGAEVGTVLFKGTPNGRD